MSYGIKTDTWYYMELDSVSLLWEPVSLGMSLGTQKMARHMKQISVKVSRSDNTFKVSFGPLEEPLFVKRLNNCIGTGWIAYDTDVC